MGVCVCVCAGDSSSRPRSLVLARQDAKREEAAVFAVCRVGRPVHVSHHDRYLLQTE